MRKYLGVVISLSIIGLSVLTGCGDDKEDNGIIVQDANGNIIETSDGIQVVGTNVDNPDLMVESDGVVEILSDSEGPLGEDTDMEEYPDLPMDDSDVEMLDEIEPIDSPPSDAGSVTEVALSTPEGEPEVVGDPGNPIEVAEDGDGDTLPEPPEGNVETVPEFSSSSVSLSKVTSTLSGYLSFGGGDTAPDGSKFVSASNGAYSSEIEADSNGMIYSAFFTGEDCGKAFIADCAAAFDAGAKAFVEGNDSGTYEANGMVFDLEANGDSLCTLRVTSKSYQSVLGNPE